MDSMLRLAAARGISPMIELMPMNKVGCVLDSIASMTPCCQAVDDRHLIVTVAGYKKMAE
jgi:hypothetical protein